jgi:hypothetical protein
VILGTMKPLPSSNQNMDEQTEGQEVGDVTSTEVEQPAIGVEGETAVNDTIEVETASGSDAQ